MSRLKFNNEQVNSRDKVSSEWMNKQFSDIRNDIRDLYIKSSAMVGKTNINMDVFAVMDNVLTDIADSLIDDSESDVVKVGVHTPESILYPSTSKTIHRANVDNVFRTITLNPIEIKSQVLDVVNDKKSVRKDIVVTRRTNNNIFLETVDEIVETDYMSPFIYNEPYIIKFKKEYAIEKANVNFTIESGSRLMTFNSFKYIPIPAIYNSVLNKLVCKKGSKAIEIDDFNGDLFSLDLITDVDRSRLLHMSIGEMSADEIYFSVDTEKYVYSISSSVIGIGYVAIEMVNYASKSYIGFEVDVPVGKDVIYDIELHGNECDIDPTNYCSWKLYESFEEFDNMSDNYVASSQHGIGTDGYRGLSSSKVYLLLELAETDNNSSPIIRSADISFREL